MERVMQGEKFSACKAAKPSQYEIEALLFAPDSGIPGFVLLDICKYLTRMRMHLDLAFMLTMPIESQKEAKAFVYLFTNMIAERPFRVAPLEKRVEQLKDRGLLSVGDTNYLVNNLEAAKRKK